MKVYECDSECKRKEIVRMIEEYILDVLAISETILRRKSEWEIKGVKVLGLGIRFC